jgi:hyperosmotically inducible periplasmic protein
MIVKHALLGLLGGAMALGGMAHADTDDKLEERVEARLKADTRLEKLDVDVKDGVATLRGEVANSTQKARAEKLARAAGARRVVNQLEIDADKAVAQMRGAADVQKGRIDERAQRDKDAIDRRTERAADRMEKGGSAEATARVRSPVVVTGEPSNGEVIVQPSITTRVKNRLMSEQPLARSEINVATDSDGVVTLKGSVPSALAEARALEVARTTDGVRKVVDNLDVKDSGVTHKVRSRFNDENALDKSELNVDTDNDGVVTLRGSVPSPTAKARAIEVARTTEGVRKVVDKIEVKAPVVK